MLRKILRQKLILRKNIYDRCYGQNRKSLCQASAIDINCEIVLFDKREPLKSFRHKLSGGN